jgi:hypothetical protein
VADGPDGERPALYVDDLDGELDRGPLGGKRHDVLLPLGVGVEHHVR